MAGKIYLCASLRVKAHDSHTTDVLSLKTCCKTQLQEMTMPNTPQNNPENSNPGKPENSPPAPPKKIILDPRKEKTEPDASVINLPNRSNDNQRCMTL